MSMQLRRLSLLAAIGLVGLALTTAPASAQQDVDQVGRYFYQDSVAPGGPTFRPRVVATVLPLADDGVATIPLPFEFELFDTAMNQITISANGALTTNGSTPSFANPALTNTDNHVIAPWWDDWNPAVGGQVRYGTVGTAPHRVFVVWWRGVPPWPSAPPNTANFQAQLFEGSDVIEFHYLDVDVSPGANGAGGTVGLDNGTTNALQYSYNTPSLSDHTAIRFTPARCGGRRATVLGTFGPDNLIGPPTNDVIVGLAGNDVLPGGRGRDLVCGGKGQDRIDLGRGNDKGFGGQGNDRLFGRVGNED